MSFCKDGDKSTVDFADVMAKFTDTDVGTLERYCVVILL